MTQWFTLLNIIVTVAVAGLVLYVLVWARQNAPYRNDVDPRRRDFALLLLYATTSVVLLELAIRLLKLFLPR